MIKRHLEKLKLSNNKNAPVLIVKLSSIGDVVLTTPILEIVKNNIQNAQISFLVEEESYPVIQFHPLIDKFFIIPRTKWQRKFILHPIDTIRSILKSFKELRKITFDVAIDFQGLGRSAIFVLLAKANLKVGRGRWCFFHRKIPMYKKNVIQHALQNYFDTISLVPELKINRDILPKVFSGIDQDNYAQKLISGLPLKKYLIIIFHTTRWDSKNYPISKWIKLINLINQNIDCNLLLSGSKEDYENSLKISEQCINKVINITGSLALDKMISLIKFSNAVITCDSGPMHIASALNIPVVALFGPTDPKRTGSISDNCELITGDSNCLGCLKRKCKNKVFCMDTIDENEVFLRLNRLLKIDD